MNSDIVSVIIIFGFIPIVIVVTFILIYQSKHKERMAMIEKGLGDALLEKKENPFQDVLMWGMLSTGIGFGLLVGYILLNYPLFHDDMILGIMAILFGGLGLIGYYFYRKRTKNKQSE